MGKKKTKGEKRAALAEATAARKLDREAKMAEALGKSLRKEFEQLDIVGREEEVSVLREILCRLEQPSDTTASASQKEMVLLHGSIITGTTVVIVFSVKSCMRPRMTRMNPIE